MLFLFGFLIWGASFIGNLPVLTMYRFGIYFVAFLLGYAVFSQERIEEKLACLWLPLTISAILFGIGYGIFAFEKDYTSDMVLQSPITNLYAWLAVLAIVAVFKRFFDRENALTCYFSRSSFGFYVLHYPVMLTVGYLVTTYLALPAICNYLFVLLGGLLGTAILYEGIRRIPFVRFAVLGIRKSR